MKYNIVNFFLCLLLIFSLNSTTFLFDKYPDLADKISYVSLCDLPTPISYPLGLSKHLKYDGLYIKRDDLTGPKERDIRLYGGNKARKLEFLLADALDKNSNKVITYGCAGSNHALATAVYAYKLGLRSKLMLTDQPSSDVVRHNLLLDKHYNAELSYFDTREERDTTTKEMLNDNKNIYFIPTGGSNKIGSLGFVNAAFELDHQIEVQNIPEPDYIYIPVGSCGSIAGLLLGLKVLNIKSKIVGVCIAPEREQGLYLSRIKKLFEETNRLLNSYDSSFEIASFPENSLILNQEFCGPGYGVWLPEAIDTIDLVKNKENITLEGTYSAKAMAALLKDIRSIKSENKTVLFWNTYCGLDYSHLFDDDSYASLPQELYKYFQ